MVVVTDGNKLSSNERCSLQMSMQGLHITTEMRLISLKGCDAVLGVQWLKTLGPITFDFDKMLMSFSHQGTSITLKGQNRKSLAGIASMTGVELQQVCQKN